MRLDGEQLMLRIYLRNTDRCGRFSSADTLVERALSGGMAGASAFRGFFGLDVASRILESRVWSLTEHVPVVVEVADTPEAVWDFLGVVERVLPEGLVTLQARQASLYRRSRREAEWACAYLTLNLPEGLLSPQEGTDGRVLKVFLREVVPWEGEPLYRTIVYQAQLLGLAGAAVFRSPLGLGASAQVRRATLFGSSRELPVVIEVVDTAAGVHKLLRFLNGTLGQGLVAIEDAWVMRYRRDDGWSRL